MNYRLHRAAVGEHYDNVAFYEERVPGLGADYLADFDAVMAHIEAWPNFYPTFGDPHIRRAGLKRFPFHVIYRAEATQLLCSPFLITVVVRLIGWVACLNENDANI